MTNKFQTLRELFQHGKNAFAEAGIENPEFDAKQLLSGLTGFHPGEIPRNEGPVAVGIYEKFTEQVQRRISGEPLQYILREWEFYSLPIKLREGVLIPRPETELLVDLALEELKNIKSPQILDLCTGSGCIAAAIAKSRPDAKVTAADYYDIPLQIAAENLKIHAPVNSEVQKIDVLSPPHPALTSRFNLITANPPYLTDAEMSALQPEVRREPPEALRGGRDGLKFYRAIAEYWTKALCPAGIMLVEIGYSEGLEAREIFEKFLTGIKIHKDLSQNDRILTGIKRKDLFNNGY